MEGRGLGTIDSKMPTFPAGLYSPFVSSWQTGEALTFTAQVATLGLTVLAAEL